MRIFSDSTIITMNTSSKHEVTILLKKLREGDKSSQDDIMKILYKELRNFAGNILNKENQTITFQATELVNEAYIRMFDTNQLDWNDRTHFLSTAIIVMRRFLVDHARKKHSEKRIPKRFQDSLKNNLSITESLEIDIVRLDDALTDLERLDERQAKIVELRFFGGFSESEIAKFMDLSRSTVNREWQSAKLWLLVQIKNR